jgi:hypothetical protein
MGEAPQGEKVLDGFAPIGIIKARKVKGICPQEMARG